MPSQPNVSKAALNKIRLAAGLIAGAIVANGVGCASGPAAQTPLRPTEPTPPPTTTVAVKPPATQAAPAKADPVVAAVGPTQVHASELQSALMEAYGFNLLMLVIQRDMARDACREQGIKVTDTDVKKEYDWTLGQMFPNLGPKDDREKLLDQYLAQPKPKDQTGTRAELKIIIDTNAHLRKLVEPSISKSVTDDMLQQQFDEEYGGQVRVRDLVVANPQEAAERRRELDNGADFATLARQFSRDPNTRRLGGELPPFTLNSTKLPANFKQMAFSLKPGEVSDPVQAAGGYHLIKLEQRIAPKAVKFVDVKDGLRQDYETKLVLEGVKGIRAKFAQQALAQLTITEPTLKAEFDSRLAARDQVIRDREKMRQEMEKDRNRAATPATAPATAPATKPTTAPAATRPAAAPSTLPATRPTPPPAPAVVAPVPTPTPAPQPSRPAAVTRPASPPVVPATTSPVVPPPVVSSTSPTSRPAAPATPAPAAVRAATRPATQPAGVVPPKTPGSPASTLPAATGPSTRP